MSSLCPSVARLPLAVAALALVTTLPNTAQAQSKFEFTPFFTSYYEISNYRDSTDASGTNIKEKQSNAPGAGARVTFWVNRQIGIQGEFAYIGTGRQATISDPTGTGGLTLAGNAIFASGRLVFRPRRSNLSLLGGIGWVKRGGDAWDETKIGPGAKYNKSNITGVLGAGVRANVTPKFAIDVTVESYFYSVDRDNSDNVSVLDLYSKKFTPDILVTIGIPFGGR